MAVAFRAGAAATGGNTITITKPTGTVSGDVMYALFLQDVTSSGLGVTLAGWTGLGTVKNTPTNSFPTTLLRRVAGGSEGASYTFTANGGSTSEGCIWTYSGVDNTTPEDATTTEASGTAASIAYPSITVVTTGAVHLALSENFNALASQPTGYTRRTTGAAWTTNSDKAVSGTVSGVTSTGGGEWVARSVLLRPAGGSPDVTLALTGVAGTGQVGSLVDSDTDLLPSVQATGSVGTVTPSVSLGITGNNSTGSVGTLSPNISIGITGVNATGSIGSLVQSSSVVLTGVNSSGQVGTVAVVGDLTIALTGVSATGQVGNVSAISPNKKISGDDAWIDYGHIKKKIKRDNELQQKTWKEQLETVQLRRKQITELFDHPVESEIIEEELPSVIEPINRFIEKSPTILVEKIEEDFTEIASILSQILNEEKSLILKHQKAMQTLFRMGK